MNLNAKNVGGACLIIHGSKSNNCARVALGDVTSHASLVGRRVKNVLEKGKLCSLEPRPKQRYSENLAFVPTEPFLTRLVQSYTQHCCNSSPRLGLYRGFAIGVANHRPRAPTR